ncbi:hypothetical protein [Acinetobacter sp. ULE_I037]
MSHKKPQRLLTIDQIVKRQIWSRIQSLSLFAIIFTLFFSMAYLALYRG